MSPSTGSSVGPPLTPERPRGPTKGRFAGGVPAATIALLAASWAALALLNVGLKARGLYEDVPSSFPISVFEGPELHLRGIPWLLLFALVLALALRAAPKLKSWSAWGFGIALIVLGNLGQGSWDDAFRKPFYDSGVQYYHDAIRIDSGLAWLRSFNSSQPDLLTHSRTHPPFAVLLHQVVLKWSAGNLDLLACLFTLFSSFSVLLVWHLLHLVGTPLEERNLLTLLFAVIPAVNIYAAVSLDGIVLTTATVGLVGLMRLRTTDRCSLSGSLLLTGGLLTTNLLTYGGLFLFAVTGLEAMRQWLIAGRRSVAISLTIAALLLAVVRLLLLPLGYDHLTGFAMASLLENPLGFRGWSEPPTYLATRVECVCEVALFLSLGFLAAIPNRKEPDTGRQRPWRVPASSIAFFGVATLGAMLAAGAYRTGEAARGALFIYPYLLLVLRRTEAATARSVTLLAGLQTAIMQLLGNYFW